MLFAFENGLRFLCESYALFIEPISTDFSKFFFKTRSHYTIHTFKNYFITMFSVLSNKRYPNRPLVFDMTAQKFQKLISKFPLLETLTLQLISSLMRLKISISSLNP